MQKKIIRIVTGSPYLAHTEPLMKEHKLLNVLSINQYGRAQFLYKSVHNLLPPNFHNYFTYNRQFHDYETRNRDNMNIPHSRLDIRKQATRTAGPTLWNSLPEHIKRSPSIEIFKRKLKVTYYKHRYSSL